MAIDENLFEKYPISELQSPHDGYKVYMKRYWIVYEGSVLRFKKTKAWQCNSFKQIVESIVFNNPLYDGCEIQYFEYLYIPEN